MCSKRRGQLKDTPASRERLQHVLKPMGVVHSSIPTSVYDCLHHDPGIPGGDTMVNKIYPHSPTRSSGDNEGRSIKRGLLCWSRAEARRRQGIHRANGSGVTASASPPQRFRLRSCRSGNTVAHLKNSEASVLW